MITISGGFFLGASQTTPYLDLLIVLLGMIGVIGAGCVFNNVIDRDIDSLMERTKNRVLVLGLMSERVALIYAALLTVIGFSILYFLTNPLTVFFAAIGFFVYVVVYSLCLKRQSTYGTLIGSVAGAVAPVVGYTAATNRFDLGAVLLFCILFLWQMPHFYAISIYRMSDFKAASLPVLPLKKTMFYTKVSTLVYTCLFAVAAILPWFFGYMGRMYFILALAVSLYWIYLSVKGFTANDNQRWAKQLFGFSVILITILCMAMALPS